MRNNGRKLGNVDIDAEIAFAMKPIAAFPKTAFWRLKLKNVWNGFGNIIFLELP